MTLRQVDFDFCDLLICSRFCWLRGSNLFFAVRFILAGSIALTLRHEFDFYSALTSIGSISLTLRHEIIFCSGSLYDIQTPGFLEIFVADSTLTCFCVCFRSSSFPLKWLPASKWPPWGQAFLCLGDGQHGPHVAPGFLLLPLCGWCRWAPLSDGMTHVCHSGLSRPGNGPLELGNQIFSLRTLSFSSLILEVIDYFDYFLTCPLPVLTTGLGNFIWILNWNPKMARIL